MVKVKAEELSTPDLLSQIEKHPGKRILDRLFAYGATARVLSGNALEARHLMLSLEDVRDPLHIRPQDQRSKLQNLFGEVFGLFHNFLASATTLIDHTRNLMAADFVGASHRIEYQRRVDSIFARDPLAQFMQGFRNYVLHRSVPAIELTHFMLPGPPRLELNIAVTPEMLKWSNWNPPAKSFLDTHQPKIRLLSLVDEYETKAREFHEGFVHIFRHHHQGAIEGAGALMREWDRRTLD